MHGSTVVASCLGLVAALLAWPGGLAAETGTISLHPDTANFSFGGGGEFGVTAFAGMSLPTVDVSVAVPGYLFQTFCLERNEALDGTQKSWSLSDAAHAGGVSGAVHGADPICAETAYLYTQFWTGTLASYDFELGADRIASSGELQAAIWYLEGEYTADQLANFPRGEAWVAEAQQAVASGHWSGIGNVRVLTLVNVGTGASEQDVLVLTSGTTTVSGGTGGGGRTPGFWGNKNGQALIDSGDIAALVACNLVDGKGDAFNPADKLAFKAWLRKGTAVNMAYMLSVQMSAMKLNVLNGFVDQTALVRCSASVESDGTISISDLVAKANTELGLHPYTPSGNAYRAYQQDLKNALDDANNNRNWVNP